MPRGPQPKPKKPLEDLDLLQTLGADFTEGLTICPETRPHFRIRTRRGDLHSRSLVRLLVLVNAGLEEEIVEATKRMKRMEKDIDFLLDHLDDFDNRNETDA